MFERYTERDRRVVFFARFEASQFGSTTIETEHFLLGLLREDKTLLDRFVDNCSAENVRAEIGKRLEQKEKVSTSLDLPLSNECKHILANAAEEAELLKHWLISTDHLLLGLLREDNSGGARVLLEL